MLKIDVMFNGQNRSISYHDKNSAVSTCAVDINCWPKLQNSVRCYVEYSNNIFRIVSPVKNYSNLQKIAFIVESPHKDEFDSCFNPIQPLNGKSGKKFNSNICSKLSVLFNGSNCIKNNTVLEIKIFNPVQYQTSFYHYLNNKIPYCPLIINGSICNSVWSGFDPTFRDNVWLFLFDNGLSQTFYEKIERYQPNYIINACTGKVVYKTFVQQVKTLNRDVTILKTNVRKCLHNLIVPSLHYVEIAHPITW